MKSKTILLVILMLISIFIIGGCSSSKDKVPPSIMEQSAIEQEAQMGSEGIDAGYSDSYYEDSGNLDPVDYGETRPGTIDPAPTPPVTDNYQPVGQKMLGYRVQIMAMSSKEGALAEAQKAADLLNVPGYVEQIGGLWKVRIGNAKTRAEAETLRDYARNNGYMDAWIVETEIVIK